MHVKTAGSEMRVLLDASARESHENIKKARWNAQCPRTDLLQPYENEAFRALIRGVGKLTGLVQNSG